MSKFKNINHLRDYVLKLCGCDTHGGRAVVLEHDKCILYDVPQWNDAMSRCTKNRFPSVDITISHASNSLTGFQILFVLAAHESSYMYSFATFLFITIASIPMLWGLFNWVQTALNQKLEL
jgi:hypothetical protein